MTTYYTYTDQELVALLQEDNQAAYTEIYNRYHAALFVHVFNKLRLGEESRDIVHDLFASLWDNRASLHIRSSLKVYLYTSARYKVFDFIARREVKSKYIDSIRDFIDHSDFITDHLVRERQLTRQIDDEISQLPPKMREIFELSRKENLTHREIAAKLNLSEKTVKNQINNSLKILRSKLSSAVFIAFIL